MSPPTTKPPPRIDVKRAPYNGPLPEMPEAYRPAPDTQRVIIAGTGRCGTTLLNRVLHAMGWSCNRNEYPILNTGTLRWEEFPGPVIKAPHFTPYVCQYPEILEAVSGVILPVRDNPDKVARNKAGKWPPCQPRQLGMEMDMVQWQDYVVGRFVRTVLAADVPLLTLPFPGYLYEPLRTWAELARFFSRLGLPELDLDTWQATWDALYEERPH